MKKVLLLVILLLMIGIFVSCPNGSEEEVIDYTIAEKLQNKTFSYYNQDDGDKWLWLKRSIVFGEIDRTTNTILVTIEYYKQENQSSADASYKDSEESTTYNIKNNSINGVVLTDLKLDEDREIDKEFKYDSLTYENCNQKYRWAKCLENSTFEYSSIITTYEKFYSIDGTSINSDCNGTSKGIYIIDKLYYGWGTISDFYPQGSEHSSFTKITLNSFVELDTVNDGNGGSYKYVKVESSK